MQYLLEGCCSRESRLVHICPKVDELVSQIFQKCMSLCHFFCRCLDLLLGPRSISTGKLRLVETGDDEDQGGVVLGIALVDICPGFYQELNHLQLFPHWLLFFLRFCC